MGWFCAFVPGGMTSMTGAKLKFTPASLSSFPHVLASARSVEASSAPCCSALGMVEKPGPASDWITPPSWFAAM